MGSSGEDIVMYIFAFHGCTSSICKEKYNQKSYKIKQWQLGRYDYFYCIIILIEYRSITKKSEWSNKHERKMTKPT